MAKSKRKTYRSKRKYGKRRNPRTRRYRHKGGDKDEDCDRMYDKYDQGDKPDSVMMDQRIKECKENNCKKKYPMQDISDLDDDDKQLDLDSYKLKIQRCKYPPPPESKRSGR